MPISRSRERPLKEIPGTNKAVVQGDPTQMRKIRCPACQKTAMAQRNNQGQFVAVCACGRTFSYKPY